jgi:uncharacterized protein
MPDRPPLPPFSLETATENIRLAEDAWNSRDPEKVSVAYGGQRVAQSRRVFEGPFGNREFLDAQMESRTRVSADQGIMGISWKKLPCALPMMARWQRHRSYGNENREFDEHGLMRRHIAINDAPIAESERKYRWPPARRPNDFIRSLARSAYKATEEPTSSRCRGQWMLNRNIMEVRLCPSRPSGRRPALAGPT